MCQFSWCLIYFFLSCAYCFLENFTTFNEDIDYCMTKQQGPQNSTDGDTKTKNALQTNPMSKSFIDPIIEAEKVLNYLLFGKDVSSATIQLLNHDIDPLVHYPSGSVSRKDLYGNKSAVHLPLKKYLYPGHCRLSMDTNDFMQTAVNAFAILSFGSVTDVLNLPRDYIMKSTRTIAMMKICQEKLAAIWTVFKGNLKPDEITKEMLQLFRPLFKYVTAREMARLNLSDDTIVTFIGTHPDLNRHQVAVVAKRYIRLNPKWRTPMYMNIMNNLLCGVPIFYMRDIDETYFLELTHQFFYHIRACDQLQRRFYLMKMTKTSTLGKPYSWNAHDVSKLGFLLTEVDGPALSTINPTSMLAITAQVMEKISAENIRHITQMQLRYINKNALNVLAKKILAYKNRRSAFNRNAGFTVPKTSDLTAFVSSLILIKNKV